MTLGKTACAHRRLGWGWLAIALGVLGCSGERGSTTRNVGNASSDGAVDEDAASEEDTTPAEGDAGEGEGADGGALPEAGAELDADAGADAESTTDGDSGPMTADTGTAADTSTPADTGSGAPDTGTSAATTFTLTLTQGTLPLPNVLVLLHDAAGMLLSQHPTDANGVFRATTVPASVSVVGLRRLPNEGDGLTQVPELLTFLAPQEGDELRAQFPQPFEGQSPLYNVLYSAQPPAGATSVRVNDGSAGCGTAFDFSPFDALAFNWRSNCPQPSSLDLFAAAINPSTSVAYGYSALSGVTPSTTPPSDLTLGAWQSPGSGTVTVANVPSGAIVGTTMNFWSPTSKYDLLSARLNTAGSSRSGAYEFPTSFANALGATVDVRGLLPQQAVSQAARQALSEPNFAFDFANPPGALSANLDASVLARPLLSWTTPGSIGSPDGIAARIIWAARLGAGPTQYSFQWTFVAPPDTTQVRVPELPDVTWVQLVTTIPPRFHLSFFESSTQAGYRDFLDETARVGTGSSHVLARELERNGSARAVTYSPL